MRFPRQTIAPQSYASNPGGPGEALVLKNLLPPDRKGVIRPRPGLVTEKTYASDIDHVSLHPGSEYLVVLEGGRLRYVNPQDVVGDDTELAADWPTGWIKHCTGHTPDGIAWLAPKCVAGSNPGDDVYQIKPDGTLEVIADVTANWLESYGTHVFATTEKNIQFCASGDATDWPGTNNLATPMKLGELFGLVGLAQHQALLIGRDGMGLLTGSNSNHFNVQFLTNERVATPVQAAADCGGRYFMVCPGPALRAYRNAMSPVHFPILDEMLLESDSQGFSAFYDPVLSAYCLASISRAKTFLFDLDRNHWTGYVDKALVGMAVQHIFGQPFLDRWVGWGNKLCRFTNGVYEDDGASFDVEVQTAPNDFGKPEVLKQLNGVYVNAKAESATISMLYRDEPEGAWSEYPLAITDCPAFVRDIPPTPFSELVIKLTAPAASNFAFKSFLIDVQEAGERT